MATPTQIHTYHCLCSHLLLATTNTTLSLLPRRASPPSLDHALILPLQTTHQQQQAPIQPSSPASPSTTLIGLSHDPKPTVVRRADGFEKRRLYRCERCACVVGYTLDEEHWARDKSADGGQGEVLFLLPGGLMSTEAMAGGKHSGEADVVLGGASQAVAAWE